MKQLQPSSHQLKYVLLLTILAVITLSGCSGAPKARQVSDLLTPAPIPVSAVENQLPGSLPDVAKGGTIYGVKCLACHGETGQGNGPQATKIKSQGGNVAKLVGSQLSQDATPADWFDVVSNGRIDKLMPGFAQSLTPQDRWDVLSYIWAMGVPSQTLPSLQRSYADACLACHGAAGKGDGPDAGSTVLTSFSDTQWLTHSSLADISKAMISGSAHAKVTLDEPQRMAMAAYVRSFGYRYSEPAVSALSAAVGDGVLRLRALNRTPNGESVAGLPVALHTYNATGEVFSRTATIDQQGTVTFEALPRDPNLFYQADLVYSGAKFFGAPMQFSTTLQISDTLSVYEVTNDPSVISIPEYHYFIQDVGEGFISVVEFYSFANLSDHAYINKLSTEGQLKSLQISLPAEATDVTFDGPGLGVRFFQEGQTIYDSDAVPPGEQATTIAMLYNLPYHGGSEISRLMSYPIGNWDVLIPDGVLRITDLKDTGVQPFHTSSIRIYTPESAGLANAGKLSFHLNGQPRAALVAGEDHNTIALGAGALAFTVLGAGLIVVRVRRSRTLEGDFTKEREALLRQIADIDNRFSAGKLPETDYRQTRQALMDDLRDIWE